MKSSYSLFILLALFTTCQPMERQIIQCDSMQDIRNECFNALARLDAQPILSHLDCHSGANKCKALPLDFDIARVTAIVCRAAKTKLGEEKAWHVTEVFDGPCYVTLLDGSCMGDGLAKRLFDKFKETECSLEIVKKSITRTMHTIKKGWQQTTLSEYPDIGYPQNENKWLLFIKPQIFYDEECLFKLCARLLNVHNLMKCNNIWGNDSKHDRKMLYLWIQTAHVGRVLTALQLKVS